MKNKDGITLVALVLTVIVLTIMVSVGLRIGSNNIDEVRLKSFYTKLEVATEGIEKISNTNESYIDENNNTIYLKQQGVEPTVAQTELIESLGYSSTNFKYFTAEEVENDLQIHGVDLNLLIDFENKIVINPEGIEIDGVKYHTLENSKYSVQLNSNKNVGTPNFTYTVENYGANKYKITITPVNVGDIKDGLVKYKKENANYWNIAKDNIIIINELARYNIKYVDANNNSITKTINISSNGANSVIATE